MFSKFGSSLQNLVLSYLKAIFSIDIRSLATFRIGLGLLLILDMLLRLPDLIAFYTDEGIIPRSVLFNGFTHIQRISFHAAGGQLWFQIIMFGLTFLAALALILGYRTRMSTIACWVLLISIHNRNEFVLQGGDALFHLIFFWAMFLPLGLAFSLDRVWAKNSADLPKSSKIFNLATIGFLVQVGFAFFFAALLKSGPEWLPEYSATMFASNVTYLGTALARWGQQFPWLLSFWTGYLWWTEFLVPIAFLIPLKNWLWKSLGIILLWIMLIGCGLGLYIMTFPIIWSVALFPFIPAQWWNFLASKETKNRQQFKFYYDQDCTLCTTAACALKGKLEVATCQSDEEILAKMLAENTMVVEDESGKRYYKFEAFLKLVETWAVGRWIAKILQLPPFMAIGQFGYNLLATNRYRISSLLNLLKYHPKLDLNLHWFWQLWAAFFLIYVTLWNIGQIQPNLMMSPADQSLGMALAINQRWDMFAPRPARVHGWIVIPGKLVDGTEVDAFYRTEGPASFEKRFDPPFAYYSQGWRKFLVDYLPSNRTELRLSFARYVCRQWNNQVDLDTPNKRLHTFQIYRMQQVTNDNGTLTEPQKILLWNHDCLG